jgi:hypothetical protein
MVLLRLLRRLQNHNGRSTRLGPDPTRSSRGSAERADASSRAHGEDQGTAGFQAPHYNRVRPLSSLGPRKPCLDGIPQLLVHNGRMLAGIDHAFVDHLASINPILEKVVNQAMAAARY